MRNDYYSVAQIAEMLHMHPKTIQRYIRQGQLQANKIGKSWRVSGHELSRFAETAQSPQPSTQAAPLPERTKVSVVMDIAVIGQEHATGLIQSLQAAMNVKPIEYGKASLFTQYIEELSIVRLTLWGNLPFSAAVLDLTNTYLNQTKESTE